MRTAEIRNSISDLCAAFNLTPRAIRYYEDRGLIEARRNRRNIRIFDAEARERLQWIAMLRAADVPLGEIARLLDDDFLSMDFRRGGAIKALERRIAHLQRGIVKAERVRARLEACPIPDGAISQQPKARAQ